MKNFLHIPTRDAKDADHLAIMLFVGGLIGIFQNDIAANKQLIWYGLSILSLITGPLLWIRIPHAKWGGVIAALLLAYISFRAIPEGALLNSKQSLHALGGLLIAYWYFAIDYDHKFEDETKGELTEQDADL